MKRFMDRLFSFVKREWFLVVMVMAIAVIVLLFEIFN